MMVDKKTKSNLDKVTDNPYNIKPEYAEDVIQIITEYQNEGLAQVAIETSKQLEDMILEGEMTFKARPEDNNITDYDLYQDSKVIQNVLEDEKLIFKCIDTYKHIHKRDPEKSSDGIDTWFNYEDKLNSITICGRTTLNVKMLHLIAMFKEIDLLESAVDQFEFLHVVRKLSFAKWVAHVGIKMPFTFSNRDCVLLGNGLFDKHEKLFIIAFASTTKKSYDFAPDVDKDHERIDMNFG
eukprot:CAMPEP_0170520312 /NCGR_PEP_ID=MMETSP0209-20121228/5575_1 /TAXON_ID=665100 ORGANISM="Litonotus pictus, Strain P1" /NCGR_SAMPLE_ID=MMETSP0209 /ASSEMBLY_ACC=CAM_ASM_000301 /LENGTH=237 /DNA_ID=CAMNT_0010806525 /DNA_START=1 /DNA_END=710 /DNA_ORIENTATION=-